MKMELRAIRKNEFPYAVDVMRQAFAVHPGFFEISMRADPRFDEEDVIGGFVDGEMVCTHTILQREIWIGGARVRLGAVANVASLPQHQGHGYASEMMRHSVEEMKRRGFAVSALFGLDRYYSRFGWKTVQKNKAKGSQIPGGLADALPQLGRWPKDIPALMEIHDDFVKRVHGPFHRSESYWRSWVKDNQIDINGHSDFWLIRAGGNPVGSINAGIDAKSGTFTVFEYSFLPGEAERTAKGIAALAQSQALDQIAFDCVEPEMEGALRGLLGNFQPHREPDMMVHLLCPESLKVRTGLPMADTDALCDFLESNPYVFFHVDDF